MYDLIKLGEDINGSRKASPAPLRSTRFGRRSRSPRWVPRVTWALAGLGTVVALVLLPLALAGGNGWATKKNLEEALVSLSEGDITAAGDRAAAAKEDALDMRGSTEGLTGFLWRFHPGGSDSRNDVHVLSNAALDLVGVVEVVVDSYPRERDGDGLLLNARGQIDVVALEAELAQFGPIQSRAVSAARQVDRVEGSAPVLGPILARVANSLGRRLESINIGLELVRPLAPVLPQLLGADSKQTLLVALLNPTEQRLSGGAALSFLPIQLDKGRLRQGESLAGGEGGAFDLMQWEPVAKNPFHSPGQALRLSTATLAPSWSISGEEMLRAWDTRSGTESTDGLVAIDVVALQKLMAFTGPIEVPGFGTLNANNLTEKLVGSYDEFTGPDVFDARRTGTQALLALFFEKLVSPKNPLGKLESLNSSASERHFAVYHRDPQIQSSMRDANLDGDLSDTKNDYVGVFNQALKGLKSDYWQRRTLKQDVTLRADGSAQVELTTTVFNDSPPPAAGVPSKYSAYVRRDNDMGLVAFLPTSTRAVTVTRDGVPLFRDGNPLKTDELSLRGRPYVTVRLKLKPQETRTVTLTYDVPRAAKVRGKELLYGLDVDPHGLVNPQQFATSVTWPRGYRPRNLPDLWTVQKGSATFATGQLTASQSWRLRFVRSNK